MEALWGLFFFLGVFCSSCRWLAHIGRISSPKDKTEFLVKYARRLSPVTGKLHRWTTWSHGPKMTQKFNLRSSIDISPTSSIISAVTSLNLKGIASFFRLHYRLRAEGNHIAQRQDKLLMSINQS